MASKIVKDEKFSSFEVFHECLMEYQREKNCLFVKAECKTVESANKALKKEANHHPECHKYRYVKYQCKLGGEHTPKGTGVRKNMT